MNRTEIKGKKTIRSEMSGAFTQPSCFLTPESVERPKEAQDFGRITPTFDRSSSVFLSPPSSSERSPVPKFGSKYLDGFPVLDLDTEISDGASRDLKSRVQRSPLLPNDRIIGDHKRGKVDMISELLSLNGDRICKSICDQLSDSDIIRFASVCRKWRNFIRDFVYDRWRSYLRERKQYCATKGKENVGFPGTNKSLPTPRTPLLSIDINRTQTPEVASNKVNNNKVQHTDSSAFQSTQTPVTRERRLCPKCTSPSNFKRMQGGHCQCEKCGLEFCSLCLRNMESHTEKSCLEQTTPLERTEQKPRRAKRDQATKRTKERLRRL